MKRMTVVFGDSLEGLGEAFFAGWEAARRAGGGPFERDCLVLADSGQGVAGWLRGKYLEGGEGRFWANLEVKSFYRFAEDLLWAAARGRNPAEREGVGHPWGAEVLPWRVYRVLGEGGAGEGGRNELRPSRGEAGAGAEDAARRWSLAEQVAEVFRDYQHYRPEMLLRRWKGGASGDMDENERWQAELWARLKEDGAGPDAAEDFWRVAREGVEAAFSHGIPRWRSVHVFAPMQVPRPHLALLERLSEAVPVTVYAFNPCRELWTEDGSRKESREAERRLLEAGELPPERRKEMAEEGAHPLLSAWGAGAKATLGALIDLANGGGGVEAEAWRDDAGGAGEGSLLRRLQEQIRSRDASGGWTVAADDASVQVHSCHTEHREMEVVKDGITTWLRHHPDAEPRDVLVLCADYERYVPHIDAVFGDGTAGAGFSRANLGLREAGGAAEAFCRLVEEGGGALKVSEVLGLLGVESVGRKFGIGDAERAELERILAGENIHWGYDGAHAAGVNGESWAGGVGDAFTWRRGLDRLLLGALEGPRRAEREGLVEAGALGEVLPTGDCEGERARLVGKLAEFVDALHGLTGELEEARETPMGAEGWRGLLGRIVGRFFADGEAGRKETESLHEMVESLCARLEAAGTEAETAAVAAALKGMSREVSRGGGGGGNAIRFDSLKCGSAVPARLIWVCGLNDGVFPRAETRPGFDLAWRRPTAWDRSARLEDGMAFLQALMEARETFVMSYVGQGVKDNRTIPPSVAVSQLLDYVGERFGREGAGGGDERRVTSDERRVTSDERGGTREEEEGERLTRRRGGAEGGEGEGRESIAVEGSRLQSRAVGGEEGGEEGRGAVVVRRHRLQGFSGEYFREGAGGSYWEDVVGGRSWDRANWHAARALAEGGKEAREGGEGRSGLAGMDFEKEARRTVELGVGTLAAFWRNPAQFILKRWEVAYPYGRGEEPEDGECLALELAPGVKKELAGRAEAPDWEALARRLVEEGEYADVRGNAELERGLEGKLREVWEASRDPELGPGKGHAAKAEYRALLEALSAAPAGGTDAVEAAVELEREGRRIRLSGGGFTVGDVGGVAVRGILWAGERKDADRVETWLEHLLLCASGREVVTVVLVRPDGKERGGVEKIAPVAREAAKARLQAIVDMAYGEYRPLIPFWPGVSMALGMGPKEAGDEAKRRQQARKAWRDDAFGKRVPPCDYTENRVLWGDAALDEHPDAERVAEAFWGDFAWEERVLGTGGGR